MMPEVWPDPVDAYTVQAGMTASFPLAPVTPGTQTCFFGAQPSPDPSGIFWGVGILDALDCTDCCNTVPASAHEATYTVTLVAERDAGLRDRDPAARRSPVAPSATGCQVGSAGPTRSCRRRRRTGRALMRQSEKVRPGSSLPNIPSQPSVTYPRAAK